MERRRIIPKVTVDIHQAPDTRTHAIVFWIHENKYTIVLIRRIKYDKAAYADLEKMVGNVFEFRQKKKVYQGEVKAIGTLQEMQEQESFWENVAVNNSVTDNANDYVEDQNGNVQIREDPNAIQLQGTVTTEIELGKEYIYGDGIVVIQEQNVDADMEGSEEQNGTVYDAEHYNEEDFGDGDVNELKRKLQKAEDELSMEKAKNRKLRRQLKKASRHEDQHDEEQVPVGGGFTIPKRLDSELKNEQLDAPAVFLRRLILDGGIFTLEEVANSSITGKKTTQSPTTPRPALCPTRFKILKEYTITSCKLDKKSVAMCTFEQRVRNICTDARRKLKKIEQTELY